MGVFERRGHALRLILLLVASAMIAACGAQVSQVLSTVGGPIGEVPFDGAAPSDAASDPDSGRQDSGVLPQAQGGDAPSAPRDELHIVYTGSLQLVVGRPAAGARVGTGRRARVRRVRRAPRNGTTATVRRDHHLPHPRPTAGGGIADMRASHRVSSRKRRRRPEVGGQIVDLEARLRNLRASEASLQEIARSAARSPTCWRWRRS